MYITIHIHTQADGLYVQGFRIFLWTRHVKKFFEMLIVKKFKQSGILYFQRIMFCHFQPFILVPHSIFATIYLFKTLLNKNPRVSPCRLYIHVCSVLNISSSCHRHLVKYYYTPRLTYRKQISFCCLYSTWKNCPNG
jgi:hypothetical protein